MVAFVPFPLEIEVLLFVFLEGAIFTVVGSDLATVVAAVAAAVEFVATFAACDATETFSSAF